MGKRSSNPKPSSSAAHNRMKAVRREGSAAEIALRKALDAHLMQYALNEQPIPDLNRWADIVFREEKVAVFVDGCFWHGCPLHGTQAKSNAAFWSAKIERNKERDSDTNQRLEEAGWMTIRIWEHDDPEAAAIRIASALRDRHNENP